MEKERLLEKAKEFFKIQFNKNPDLAVAAPGRANLIGEHTDYNDGHVLPIAIDRYIVAAVSNRSDTVFRLYAKDFDEGFSFDSDDIPKKWPPWAAFIVGVVVELQRNNYPVTGKDILVHGDLPMEAGLSSSAALEVATATAIERLEKWEISDSQLVSICRRADHNFVGVKSGPMDQYASRACRKDHAGLLDCRSLEMIHQKLPDGVEYISIYSGIPRSLVASDYNERQISCQRAVELLKRNYPQIVALRDATPDLVESEKKMLGDMVYRRALHVVSEQRRVFDLIDSFERHDISRSGEILYEGHRSLSTLFEVSLPVLDEMIDWLYKQPHIIGARLTGAGFGGSMICLVEAEKTDVNQLSAKFCEVFDNRTPKAPRLLRLTSVDGAKFQTS